VNANELAKLSDAWVKHAYEIEAGNYEGEYSWAWDKEFDIKYENPSLHWQLILAVHSLDQSAPVAQVLAAGPLEDILANHGSEFIELIEAKAKEDPSFAFLLGGVWRSSMSEEIWGRVQAVWDRRGWDGIPKES